MIPIQDLKVSASEMQTTPIELEANKVKESLAVPRTRKLGVTPNPAVRFRQAGVTKVSCLFLYSMSPTVCWSE